MDNESVIDTLNSLIETCKDGEYGFARCSESAKRGDLYQVFADRADDCRLAALELQALVTRLGGRPEVNGTAGGGVHRGWVAVKTRLSGYNDLALLEECERGEDLAVQHYRSALATELPASVLQIVQQQYKGVSSNHALMRALRSEARAATYA